VLFSLLDGAFSLTFPNDKMKSRILVSVLVASALVGVFAFTTLHAQRERPVEPRSITPRGALLEPEKNLIALFDRAAPSVAYITTETQVARGFFGEQIGVEQGAGSGFVWDNQGHIVTNNHVVEGNPRILVQLESGKEPIVADRIGSAPEYDLAVVKLRSIPSGIVPIPLGTSRDLKIGQSVIAIGNPFGLDRTMTTGIVSALDRNLPTQNFAEISGVIQTDAAVNPGNSGGPLLDSAGRLVGVNTAIRSTSGSFAGVSLAIPVDVVNRIVPQLIARGVASRPGIGIDPVNPVLTARAGIRGVVVDVVRPDTPAAQAGLKGLRRTRTGAEIGDVIVAVNGKTVDTLSNYFAELDRVGIGNTAELTVVNDGKTRKERVRVVDTNRGARRQ
jgi:2-alkenal reductase